MIRAALVRSCLLAAATALLPGATAAQDSSPGPKLPAMPSLAKDNGDTTKPAGALPPPAPKPEESKKPEPAKKAEPKKAESNAGKNAGKTAGRKGGAKTDAKPAERAGRAGGKHGAKGAPAPHRAAKHSAAKPHAASRGKRRR